MDARYALATFTVGVGYTCGHCGSTDNWLESQTDVGCADCGTLLDPSQLDEFYEFEDANYFVAAHDDELDPNSY